MALSFVQGSWPDVCAVPTGFAFVRIVDQTTVVADVNGVEVWRVVMAGRPRWLRCAADPSTGEVRAIVTMNTAPTTDRAFLVTSSGAIDLGINIKGIHGTVLTFEAGFFTAYLCETTRTYRRWVDPPNGAISAAIANPFDALGVGTVQGITQVIAGVPQWDESLTAPGSYSFVTLGGTDFYHYNIAGTVTVGQTEGPPDTAEGIIAWDGSAVSVLTTIQGFDPHVAIVSVGPFAGQAIVVWRSVDVSIANGLTANTGFSTGLQGSASNGLANLLSGLYRIPFLEQQKDAREQQHRDPRGGQSERPGRLISLPWYDYFVKQAQSLATPINLASNDVTGILPGSNLPFDPAFLVVDLGLLTGLTGDVEATGPGEAEATIVRQYVPVVVGENIVFVGGDGVALVKTEVGV